MAEGTLTTLASKVLTKVPDQCTFLSIPIQEILIWLPYAERQQDESSDLRDWINRVRDALYDAEDLFDPVASDTRIKQQIKESRHFGGGVRISFSKYNPFNDVRKNRFKAVVKNLNDICIDRARFRFQLFPLENQRRVCESSLRETHSYEVPEALIGREEDKNAIVELLYDESPVGQRPTVIAIAGITGIGKTTLAQLVYNDDEVSHDFESRWWVSIAGLSNEHAILARILKSINGEFYYSISQLRSAIVQSIEARRYLLVLDDVRHCTASSLLRIMPLLSAGEVGSRIIITTPSMAAVKAMHVEQKQIYQLRGLREEESWKLFKTLAFRSHEECASDTIGLGRQISKQCDGVPLYITSIARYLLGESLEVWRNHAEKNDLFCGRTRDSLLESYFQLPSTLQRCLAYCYLFPKDYVFRKEELTHLWIGQEFVIPMAGDPRLVEDIAYGYLMELSDMCFFQEARLDESGEVISWTMNCVIYQLVQYVYLHESSMRKFLHFSIGYKLDESWDIPLHLLEQIRCPLHSFLFLYEGSLSPLVLSQVLTEFKMLRALNLRHQKIEVVPSSIGELKLLRYLNLSHNKFWNLPSSIAMLVNLFTLDISWCDQLELFPDNFRRLCSLRHLDTRGCYRLRHMPPGIEELTSLQCLSLFKVGKAMGTNNSKPDVLAMLDLKGDLEIRFDEDMNWGKHEYLYVPLKLRVLIINNYPGMRILSLKTIPAASVPTLVSLHIDRSSKIKQISVFRGLPSLQSLQLVYLEQLEYIEIEEDETAMTEHAFFFPCLKVLKLEGLPKLKGWSRKVEADFISHGKTTECLPVLADLTARCCQEFKFMPLCPRLKMLELNDVNGDLIQHLLSPSSTASSSSMPSSSLETVEIQGCKLLSFPLGTLTSLCCLRLSYCYELKKLSQLILHLNALKELVIDSCPKLELWGEEKRGIDWDLLPKLCKLTLIGMPSPHELPGCLQQRQAHGKLIIKMDKHKSTSNLSVHPLINKGPLLTTYSRPAKA